MQPSLDGRRVAARRDGRVRVSDHADLDTLNEAAAGCVLCRLCHDRTLVATGSGPADAAVVVVTDAPGYHEDRAGALLVGPTGVLFDELLRLAGLGRDDVYVTSVVKCRPPTGRAPFPDEVEACEGWLFREIALVRPKVVVTLGALALRLVTGREQRVVRARGQVQHAQVQGRDVLVWPMLHPAAASHVVRLVDTVRDDARALGALLRGAHAADRPRREAAAAQADPAPAVAPPAPATPATAAPTEPGAPQLTFDIG